MVKTQKKTQKKKEPKVETEPKKESKNRLSRIDLLRLNLSHITQMAFREGTTRRYAQAEHMILEAEKNANNLRQEAEEHSAALKDSIEKHEVILLEFIEKYGVDFAVATYDTETGKIQVK